VNTRQVNNFDLIRLAAALQVAYIHGSGAFGRAGAPAQLTSLLSLFPGVPVFFFISGFLISRSFESNPNWRDYARNRILRIYPALGACCVVTLAASWLSGFFLDHDVGRSEFLAFIIAQLTIGQFYIPAWVVHPPIRSLNGSLWTIAVELQFYVLIPLLYKACGLLRASRRRSNWILGVAVGLTLFVSEMWTEKNPATGAGGPIWPQIPPALFLPWVYMFLAGILAQRNCAMLCRWVAGPGRLAGLLPAYVAFAAVTHRYLHWALNDAVHPLLFLGLVLVTVSAAFTVPTLSERVLRRNDVSYGLYIYHQPVINVLWLRGLFAGGAAMVAMLLFSLALAFASWTLIEKRALALKRHSLYAHRATAVGEPAGERAPLRAL